MRATVLLLVALLAVASHGVTAQRPKGEKGFTALWAMMEGSIDDSSCGMDGQVCCKDFKCKEKGSGCVPLQSQRPTCMKCGKGNQPCCPGLVCESGAKVNASMPYCPVVSRPNPPPQRKGRTRSVVRRVRKARASGAVAGAAVSAASATTAAAAMSADIAAFIDASKPAAVVPDAAATAPAPVMEDFVEEDFVEDVVTVTASAEEEMAMVDMSAGALNRPCRTQELWPGMPACDEGTCQFAVNGSPGICQ